MSNRSSCRSVELAGVALLKPQVVEAGLGGALVARVHEVPRDVDAEHVGPETGRGDRGRAVAAAQVEDVDALCDPDPINERGAAVAHARRDAGEVAFLPERLVRIHRRPSFSIENHQLLL